MAENKEKRYIIDNTQLMAEWDWEKNNKEGISPNFFTYGSHKKAWWKCSNGHSWNSIISNRARLNRKCPYCAGQKVIIGENDLCTTHPLLAKEWNYEKNINLLPENYMGGSHKKVWWKCSKGHEWMAEIKSRCDGVGCPYCSNKLVLRGFNDLATTHPELASEWHPTRNEDLTPHDFTFGSGKSVWWKCKNGHEWSASIDNRTKGRGCPICFSRRRTSFPEQAIFYYVKKVFPDAINSYRNIFKNSSMEIDIFIPSINTGVEFDGKQFHSQTNNIIRDTRKYEICKENGIKLIRITDNTRKDILRNCEFSITIPDTTDSSLNCAIIFLLYKLGHHTQVNISRDRLEILKYLTATDISLTTSFPDIAEEWNYDKNKGLEPDMFHPGSNEKVWWKCKVCGYEWKTSLAERTGRDKTNCPQCAKIIGAKKRYKSILNKTGSLAKNFPDLLSEWNYEKNNVLPQDITAGSGKKIWWKCKVCGHEWKTSVSHRTSRHGGCPCCSNKVTIKGKNDIATTHPELLNEWNFEKNSITPYEIVAGSGKKVWWKCKVCGYEWFSSMYTRSNGSGCPNCAREKRKNSKPNIN